MPAHSTCREAATALAIDCQGEQLLLHSDKAAYWAAQRTLLVADVHFGKESSFGRAGIAIPGGVSEQDLQRLGRLVAATGAEHLCILGDFMHAAPATSDSWPGSLSAFLDAHQSLHVSVVAGNHDREAGRARIDSRVRWTDDASWQPPFVLQHEPGHDSRGYVLCGHLHPAFRVGAPRKHGLRAPVFWFRSTHAVLPAFGAFTGGVGITPAPGDRLFVTGPNCVLPVSVR